MHNGTLFLAGRYGVRAFVNDRWSKFDNINFELRVNSIKSFQGQLLISGTFDFQNDLNERVRYIASWDGQRWRPFVLPEGTLHTVSWISLTVFQNVLYVSLPASTGQWHALRSGRWEPLPATPPVRGTFASVDLGSKLLLADSSVVATFDGTEFALVPKPSFARDVGVSFIKVGGKAVWGFTRRTSSNSIISAGVLSFDGSTWEIMFEWNRPLFIRPIAELNGRPVVLADRVLRVVENSTMVPLEGDPLFVSTRIQSYAGQAVAMSINDVTAEYRVGLGDPLGVRVLPGVLDRATSIAANDHELYLFRSSTLMPPIVIDGVARGRLVRWSGSEWITIPEPPSFSSIDALLPEPNKLTAAIGNRLYTFESGVWTPGAELTNATNEWTIALLRDGDAVLALLQTPSPRDLFVVRITGSTVERLSDGVFSPYSQLKVVAAAYGRVYALGFPTSLPPNVLPSPELAYWNGSGWTYLPNPSRREYRSITSWKGQLLATRTSSSGGEIVRVEPDHTFTVLSPQGVNAFDLAPAGDNVLFTESASVRNPSFLGCLCPGDFNLDNIVDDADFCEFAAQYAFFRCQDGRIDFNCPADFNRDGFVDDQDFVMFSQSYKRMTCP